MELEFAVQRPQIARERQRKSLAWQKKSRESVSSAGTSTTRGVFNIQTPKQTLYLMLCLAVRKWNYITGLVSFSSVSEAGGAKTIKVDLHKSFVRSR